MAFSISCFGLVDREMLCIYHLGIPEHEVPRSVSRRVLIVLVVVVVCLLWQGKDNDNHHAHCILLLSTTHHDHDGMR